MSAPRNSIQRVNGLALRIDGLTDLRNALRGLDEQLPVEMRGTNKRVVETLLVPHAQTGARAMRPTSGYNARTGRSRYHWSDVVNSIRALASQDSASIALGRTGQKTGWMLGYEFGSLGNMRPQNGPTANTRMYPRQAGTGTNAGRFFFPAIRQSGPELVDAYQQALDGIIQRTKEFQARD